MIHHHPPGVADSNRQFTWSLIHSSLLPPNSNPVIITPLCGRFVRLHSRVFLFSIFLARAFIHQCSIRKDQHGNYFSPIAHLRIPGREGTEIQTIKQERSEQ